MEGKGPFQVGTIWRALFRNCRFAGLIAGQFRALEVTARKLTVFQLVQSSR